MECIGCKDIFLSMSRREGYSFVAILLLCLGLSTTGATAAPSTTTMANCKNNPNPATYDTVTKILSIPTVDIPVIDPFTGKGTGNYAVFNSTLQMLDGVEDFKIKTINYLNMLSAQDPTHATYEYFYDNTSFSNGGALSICVSVPQVVIIPPGIQVVTTLMKFEVVMQQLALDNTVFHISSIQDALGNVTTASNP